MFCDDDQGLLMFRQSKTRNPIESLSNVCARVPRQDERVDFFLISIVFEERYGANIHAFAVHILQQLERH